MSLQNGLQSSVSDDKGREASVAQLAAHTIRRGIEVGVYVPGQRLVETDLMAELGVSRSSLREAFQYLLAEEIIDIVPAKGAIVRRLTAEDLRDIQLLRKAIEPLAASLAAAAIDRPGVRPFLQRVFGIWRKAPPVDDAGEFANANRDFHRAIVQASGSQRIATVTRRLSLPIFAAQLRLRVPRERRILAATQHWSIGQAILAGNAKKASELMAAHVTSSDNIVAPEADPGPATFALVKAGSKASSRDLPGKGSRKR